MSSFKVLTTYKQEVFMQEEIASPAIRRFAMTFADEVTGIRHCEPGMYMVRSLLTTTCKETSTGIGEGRNSI